MQDSKKNIPMPIEMGVFVVWCRDKACLVSTHQNNQLFQHHLTAVAGKELQVGGVDCLNHNLHDFTMNMILFYAR